MLFAELKSTHVDGGWADARRLFVERGWGGGEGRGVDSEGRGTGGRVGNFLCTSGVELYVEWEQRARVIVNKGKGTEPQSKATEGIRTSEQAEA